MTKNYSNQKIKVAMFEAGLTQKELAAMLGVKQQLISKWITGILNPKLQSLKKIAEATGKPLNFFLGDIQGVGDVSGTGHNIIQSGNIKDSFNDKEAKLLKKELELSKREIEILKKELEFANKGKK
jgi:transcriptional regulator with XRE-family HTH domain